MTPRTLAIVTGDQLSHDLTSLAGLDPRRDAVLMCESVAEIEARPTHKTRIAFLLAAMRHFRDELQDAGFRVTYHQIDDQEGGSDGPQALTDALETSARQGNCERVLLTRPGSWRMLNRVRDTASAANLPLEVLPDDRFLCSVQEFRAWANDRQELRLEDFYRWMRRRHEVLLDADGGPIGGAWNYDRENREAFGKEGPPDVKAPRSFRPDATTRTVLSLVEERWPEYPGSLEPFDLPVTHAQALAALRDFLHHRLPTFGRYQDAMWSSRPFLSHSRLSAALNAGLLDPQHAVREAERAHRERGVRLASVEGFIRQVLGWREFVRGIYWTRMPEYAERNHLGARRALPEFYWSGRTDMECVRRAMGSVLRYGYAHHIQRLMVLGQFALLYGVDPAQFNEWHLAMYVDAVDWVSLPNAAGMSQFADGGVVGSKPYCASGAYIDRMSNHCGECRYAPDQSEGERACPFTVLYWDFLARHEKTLRAGPRMGLQYANLDRKKSDGLEAIRATADTLRRRVAAGGRI